MRWLADRLFSVALLCWFVGRLYGGVMREGRWIHLLLVLVFAAIMLWIPRSL